MSDHRPGSPPLIVTALLPADLQRRADRLRQAHFPPERNHIAAHVTLFHALPGNVLDEARRLLAAISGSARPISAVLSGVMDLGNGTALCIESAELLDLREQVAEHFHGLLTAQDNHTPRLHVTVQNKVTRQQAIALQQELAATFRPQSFTFAGLALHRYLGGPWEDVGKWPFRGSSRRHP